MAKIADDPARAAQWLASLSGAARMAVIRDLVAAQIRQQSYKKKRTSKPDETGTV